jgi:hypothetical protein
MVSLQGAFTHQDFAGHKGTIKAGDLQVGKFSFSFGLREFSFKVISEGLI